MIELNIKIKAKDQDTVKLFIEIMTKAFETANKLDEINVDLYAEKNGDTVIVTRKEILNT